MPSHSHFGVLQSYRPNSHVDPDVRHQGLGISTIRTRRVPRGSRFPPDQVHSTDICWRNSSRIFGSTREAYSFLGGCVQCLDLPKPPRFMLARVLLRSSLGGTRAQKLSDRSLEIWRSREVIVVEVDIDVLRFIPPP
ncbi:hypothetical protein BDV27DRAFT_7863 [Aspergillus caelatus]|uniref:Uncharacterized protein n=1 Tax=Aspergillus caelatus TaxID=61420 RepID=A0A5N7A0F1_9EURO|nr:uncharacterized protein BDV27DRAFT_7863 [Aspergillus caelatus]KAE8363344.1 hypothetical protein BDV27DRAFT_7863 [Aspergillus caelatus]